MKRHDQAWCFLQGLAKERPGLKAAQRQLQHEHVQLLKNKAATQGKLAELQQKAVDVPMLKFGQVQILHIVCGLCMLWPAFALGNWPLDCIMSSSASIGWSLIAASRLHRSAPNAALYPIWIGLDRQRVMEACLIMCICMQPLCVPAYTELVRTVHISQ